MKKRLRKKKRVGEFTEYGFKVCFSVSPELSDKERNAVIEAFIAEAIESNGLQFGGGGGEVWEGFVALNKPRGSVTQAQRSEVHAWLKRNPRIEKVWVGALRDAWHGYA